MSKRRGDVVFLDEFLDEVGVDAARWYLVSRGPDQTIEIDVDLAAEKSQKNPVYYVQYAHARIAGILRNAGDATPSAEPPAELADEERDLIKRLAEFPAIVAEATERRRAARDPDLRDPARRRLPPLLPPAQGARLRGGGIPARPRHRDEVRDRALAGLDRRRGTRHDVTDGRGRDHPRHRRELDRHHRVSSRGDCECPPGTAGGAGASAAGIA